jgi:transposase-like protein
LEPGHRRVRAQVVDRDVEATLAEALGEDATLSQICTEIKTEMDARGSSAPRGDGAGLDYLFLDASFFRYRDGAAAEPVLAAWGITTEGQPVFVGVDSYAGESTDGWAGFLTNLGARGLRCPLLVISDGAPGVIAAVEQTMPARCASAALPGGVVPLEPPRRAPASRSRGQVRRGRPHQLSERRRCRQPA